MNWGSLLSLLITNGLTLLGGVYATNKKFQSSTQNRKYSNEIESERLYAEYSKDLMGSLENVQKERDTLSHKVNELQKTVNEQSITIKQQNLKLDEQNATIKKQSLKLDEQSKKINTLMESVNKLTRIIEERGIHIEEN